MKSMILLGLIAAALAGWSGAQSTSEPANAAPPAQSSNSLASGTTIPVELSKTLDAKRAKAGDKIEARLPADVLAKGKIVIPRSAKIIGHVLDAKPHSKESPDSRVSLAFDRIVMKDGRELPLQVLVQAIARPLQVGGLDSRMNDGSSLPGGSASSGGGMGTPRSTERVAAIPIDAGSDATPPPTTVAPLGPTSQGVVGMKGLLLKSSAQSSVVSSEADNVHLESGTQMMLRVE